MFLIKSDSATDDVCGEMGRLIDAYRDDISKSEVSDFGLIDQLDQDLYNQCLETKSTYNILVPYTKSPSILTTI